MKQEPERQEVRTLDIIETVDIDSVVTQHNLAVGLRAAPGPGNSSLKNA